MVKTIAYGFPRLGQGREYKKSVENTWKQNFSKESIDALEGGLKKLQSNMVANYQVNVDEFATNELTAYDFILDAAVLIGLYKPADWEAYYNHCRGGHALEMTKWLNTNYHYLVPEFEGKTPSDLSLNTQYFNRFNENPQGVHFLVGPYTLLRLSKGVSENQFPEFLNAIAKIYAQLLKEIPKVHLHEPAFVLDVPKEHLVAIKKAYELLGQSGSELNLITYYDSVDFLELLYELPVAGIGLDFVSTSGNLQFIEKNGFPKDKRLIAGVIDGSNVWKADGPKTLELIKTLASKADNLSISNAKPLFHLPHSLEGEVFEPALAKRLAFAVEKLQELKAFAEAFKAGTDLDPFPNDDFGANSSVQERIQALKEEDFVRLPSYEERAKAQEARFKLPLFPTTTIGSFPQTPEIRKKRTQFRKGTLSQEAYEQFIRDEIKETIEKQEALDLDVFVHGESERTDMVEFFAEKLEGVAFSKNGWVLSYGTRSYRPPIIFGDVNRPKPMTIQEIKYAQSLTKRPVKGMLTGPVTLIAWSFIRTDIPVETVAYQLGLALQDEVADYEKAGIGIIQIDEPAFREYAPNKRSGWKVYFDWAIKSFRLCSTKAQADTQIHSHMCYSEFNEIIEQIEAMDFDVVSIEATRSRGEVMESFEKADFSRGIGLGVYDIHSPVIPEEQAMANGH